MSRLGHAKSPGERTGLFTAGCPALMLAVRSFASGKRAVNRFTVEQGGNRLHKKLTQVGVGMPAFLKLLAFGDLVWDAFGDVPYHVGSSLKGKQWRDVDVRLILDDAEYERQFGTLTHPHCLNRKWNAMCIAFSYLGQQMTDLPIDFQIDQQTEANALYPNEPRSAIFRVDRAEQP